MNPQNEILRIVADNPSLLEALRKLFQEKFAPSSISNQMTNELIGQITRARFDGLQIISEVFKEIEQHKTVPEPNEKPNPAR